MSLDRGAVVSIDLEPTIGHEQRGIRPVVGVPLPLVSYGGTAMLTLMAGIGFLLNAAVHRTVDTTPSGRRTAPTVPAWGK